MNSLDRNRTPSSIAFHFRTPEARDGAALWRLVQSTATLDLNSPYFYLIFATDFSDSCLVAERPSESGELAGAVIGYRPPREPDTAFVWQIGVHPSCQRQGLGLQLLRAWMDLPGQRDCRWLSATVADENTASKALFQRFAREHGALFHVQPHFDGALFPIPHPAEPILRIGPFVRSAWRQATAFGASPTEIKP